MGSDSYDEMHLFLPGDDTYDRLLSGRLSPLDTPASLRGVAALFEAAASPASPSELVRRNQVIAAARVEVLSSQPQPQITPSRRRAMLSKVLTAKFAAAATVAAFGIGTAAAATGSLPGQTSHANSHAATGLATAAANVGSHTSGSSTHGNTSSGSGASSSGASKSGASSANASIPATGPANSHAQYGLCTAFLAGGANQTSTSGGSAPSTPPQYSSTAFKALIAQNNGVAGTTTYCKGVVANPPSTNDAAGTGRPADAGKPADAGRPPASAGSSQGHAQVSTPNSGGAGTANSAGNAASSGETSTSGAASNGARSVGSGNAPTHP